MAEKTDDKDTSKQQPPAGDPPADPAADPNAQTNLEKQPDDAGPREMVPPGTPAPPGPAQDAASWRQQQIEQSMRFVPAPRDRRAPVTSAGPLEPDQVMSEQELWQRAESEHLAHNQRELERASNLGELLVVESNLADDRVAFSEIDDRHPHSHCYVAGRNSPPQIVGRTEGIEQAILDRKIRVVRGQSGALSRGPQSQEESQPAGSRRR